ncbi:MAG TPA: efflux RND transporter periplasmic adaptor subunit [Verrucomicrobiae bacterium]|nr:efflux RND transporter periplasmic adaptor subunit [Verrucomicrobiae bacterium]
MRFLGNAVALLGGLCAAVLVSCGKSDNAKAQRRGETQARAVRVARAELRPMERTVQVVGTLSAHDEATMAAQVAGQIEKSHVDVGDRVTAGQELALIDTTSYEAFARQSAANLTKAIASAANAAQNLKRVQELQKEKIASTSDLDQAVAEAGKTQADVTAAEATDAIARLNLERSRVKAPFDAAVAARIASVGNYVGIGAPIVRLVQTDPLRLRLEAPERESSAVRVGQSVRFIVEGDTNVYTGKIARIAPAIREADRMLQVEADVPNRFGLRAGLFARAQIVVNEREEGVCVPAKALLVFAGLEKVVVVKDGKAAEKTVTTGRHGPDWVEIVSGLGAGETVVLDPAGIRTGQALMIQGAEEKLQTSRTNTESGQ